MSANKNKTSSSTRGFSTKNIRTTNECAVEFPVVSFLPAIVKRDREGWRVDYRVLNPATMKLYRKKVRLNKVRSRFGTAKEFKAYCAGVCLTINNKLAGGWNPFYEDDNLRLYVKLSEVIEEFLSEKERELRPDSMRSYRSFCNTFLNWCAAVVPDIYASMFNKVLAVRYLDYQYNTKKLSARTYNNQLKMARSFFEYALEKCYIKENPFATIKNKREQEKVRILIPPETRSVICDYLGKNNIGFLLMCNLVFSSLVRPKEICMIKVKHIDFINHCVEIPAANAKNHHTRYAPLTDECLRLMELLGVGGVGKEYYLVGRTWMPSLVPLTTNLATKEWNRLREKLHLAKEMQLYSLRDTGINNMIKSGIDPLTVMQAADHHDLAMTTRYANHRDDRMIDKIREDAPKF